MSFSQRQLWEVMQQPRTIASTDEMEATLEKYPYFQVVHTLVAKAKHDQQAPDAYAWLGKAAVYAPDRRLLRRVFYDELVLTTDDDTATTSAEPAPPPPAQEQEVVAVRGNTLIVTTTEAPDTDDPPVDEGEVATDTVAEVAHPESEATIRNDDETLREELEQSLQTLRDSKERLPDSTDRAATSSSAWEELPTETPETTPEEEAVSNATPPTPQQAIIDRFMKANPSISREAAPDDTSEKSDLSVASTELHDDMVTENLAEIMCKQGKDSKAIDLYEKLILKFPEKKAYFAEKIDQLKNN